MHCDCSPPMAFHWLPRDKRRLFRISPLRVIGSLEPLQQTRFQKGDRDWLLVSAFDGEARLRRVHKSVIQIPSLALDFAGQTQDPTVVAQVVGLDKSGLPVFESVGMVRTEKLDPTSPAAFQQWTIRMAKRILGVSESDMRAMSVRALENLTIDFGVASPEQIDRALYAYASEIANPTQTMIRAQRVEITQSLQNVIAQTGNHTANLPEVRANLATGFRVPDERAARLIAKNHSFWVRDRYNVISQSMSSQARTIISRGLERGLDQNEIARELARMTHPGVRAEGYYKTTAAVHVARGRSYSTGYTYRSAGINFFKIEAVLDDRTTHQCEFLHGRVLPVGPSMANIERSLASPDPEAVLVNQPFIVDAGDRLTVTGPGGTRTVANIDSRSTGASPTGTTAVFSNGMSQSDLVSASIGFPPYHFGCRTTTVAM